MSTNFSHLRTYDDQLFRLGRLAERYFPDDPNTALLKLLTRQDQERREGASGQQPLGQPQQTPIRADQASGLPPGQG